MHVNEINHSTHIQNSIAGTGTTLRLKNMIIQNMMYVPQSQIRKKKKAITLWITQNCSTFFFNIGLPKHERSQAFSHSSSQSTSCPQERGHHRKCTTVVSECNPSHEKCCIQTLPQGRLYSTQSMHPTLKHHSLKFIEPCHKHTIPCITCNSGTKTSLPSNRISCSS
jgi:hypothetical protein